MRPDQTLWNLLPFVDGWTSTSLRSNLPSQFDHLELGFRLRPRGFVNSPWLVTATPNACPAGGITTSWGVGRVPLRVPPLGAPYLCCKAYFSPLPTCTEFSKVGPTFSLVEDHGQFTVTMGCYLFLPANYCSAASSIQCVDRICLLHRSPVLLTRPTPFPSLLRISASFALDSMTSRFEKWCLGWAMRRSS